MNKEILADDNSNSKKDYSSLLGHIDNLNVKINILESSFKEFEKQKFDPMMEKINALESSMSCLAAWVTSLSENN